VEQLESNVEAASVRLEPSAVAALTDAARAFNPAGPARLLVDAGLSRLSRR
jgi:aryl-alcohol dehydrogenase-like predicted oxidoreductase